MSQHINKHTSVISLSQLLKRIGLDQRQLKELLRQCDLSREALEDPNTALSLNQEFTLIRKLIEQTKDPLVGLIAGSCYRLNTFGPLGLAVTSAATFRDAVELFIEYLDLTYTLFDFSFNTSGPKAYIEFSEVELLGDLYEYYRDRDLAFVITAMRDVVPGVYAAISKRLELSGPEPGNLSEYESFFDCPVSFDHPHNRFWFDARALVIELPQANELNLKLLKAQCEEQRIELSKAKNFSEIIIKKIKELADNCIPTMEDIANSLNLNPRAIRRKLKNEDNNFQQLLNEFLASKALALLENSKLSIEDIGDQLGYSEPAAFIHAFKRWTGKTPLQFRQWH